MSDKPLSDKAYVKAGAGLCPYCQGKNIMCNGYPEPSGVDAVGRVDCKDCGETWFEVWKMIGWMKPSEV